MQVRRAEPGDLQSLVALRCKLWPDSAADHPAEAEAILAGHAPGALPAAVFVAEDAGGLVGFVEVDLRSHADGCDPSLPCGFLEGWYVEPEHRRRGVGRLLVDRAAEWARQQGCVELASDTWLDNQASQSAHLALGFEIVDRCVHFRRDLGPAPAPTSCYGAELARLHHQRYGEVARAASRELLSRLAAAGVTRGTLVDLGCGSGILARAAAAAGFDVFGVDLSPDMLAIARRECPSGRFVQGSLWEVPLPPCVAVAAIGETFSYAAEPTARTHALARRLAAIHEALAPGGLLLFDVAGPGRSGAGRARSAFARHDRVCIGVEEREDGRELTRRIHLFVPDGDRFRELEETHVMRLYAPDDVERALARAGFICERLAGYGELAFTAGWHGFAAARIG